MPSNRLRILALLAALFALATAFAACGGDDASPEAVVENATLEGAESGDLDLSLSIDAKGGEGGTLDVSISGPFQTEGEGQPPRLDLTLKSDGELGGDNLDFNGGLVLLPSKAFVNYEGVYYEVDPTTYSFVKSSLEEAMGEGAESGTAACQEAASELEVGDFLTNLSDEGSADVGGTSTTKITGDLDISSALDSLIALTNDPACKSQLSEEGPFSFGAERLEAIRGTLETAIKSAPVEIDVGDDDIIRKATTELTVEPEEAGVGPERIDFDLDFEMTGVNEEQAIVPPSKAKPLNDLFLKLNVNPIELLGLLEGGEAGDLGNLLGPGGGNSGN